MQKLIESDPEKMHGAPVFRGTRVPVQNLFDYIEGGDSLDVFLEDFPTVTHEQALGVYGNLPKHRISQANINLGRTLDYCGKNLRPASSRASRISTTAEVYAVIMANDFM